MLIIIYTFIIIKYNILIIIHKWGIHRLNNNRFIRLDILYSS